MLIDQRKQSFKTVSRVTRIQNYVRISVNTASDNMRLTKIVRKPLIPTVLGFFMTSYLKKRKTLKNKMVASWRSRTKIAGSGSGSGSIGQRLRSADPDPYQNVTDPQYCMPEYKIFVKGFEIKDKFTPRCGTVTIFYGSGSVRFWLLKSYGSGSDFWHITVPVPDPYLISRPLLADH